MMDAGSGNLPVVWFHPAIMPAGQPIPSPAQVTVQNVCPSLPSSNSAYDLLTGKPGSLLTVGRDFVVRGALIGTGLWVYDQFRDPSNRRTLLEIFADGLAGSAAIEAFVLLWISQTSAARR